jgi:hypothetical protein
VFPSVVPEVEAVVRNAESRSSHPRPPFASDEKIAEILIRSIEETNDEKRIAALCATPSLQFVLRL